MLTQLDVRNGQGAMLSLPLQDISAGYIVKDITGLDPVKATIVSSNFALMDGAKYQSSRREPRNIVVTLGVSSDYVLGSVRELRNRLYAFFMPKSVVNLTFITISGAPVNISGHVETCEAALFTKEPEVVISILCFDPDFRSLTPTVVSGNSVSDMTETPINYQGTVETGVLFRMNINRVFTELAIQYRPPDGTLKELAFIAPLVAADILEISTFPGSKRATRIRAGVDHSVLYGITAFSDWFKLYPGINNVRVYSAGTAIPYTIEYTNKFGGL